MIRNWWLERKRRKIWIYLPKRFDWVFKKKKPISDKYPYITHDPFSVLGESSGYESLYLVGDRWIDEQKKPIALGVGFNDWKLGFIADYLPNNRVAFFKRKATDLYIIKSILNLREKPELVLIWGYNEGYILRFFLKKNKIKVLRVEDGFLRSADLGANHSTPYSLVFDDVGLYYDSTRESKVEKILMNHDFDSDEIFLNFGTKVFDIFLKSGLSKYNKPYFDYEIDVKISKVVLVVGQVAGDASLKYGNPDQWSMEDMIFLAKYENPEAEILYRPHPEVYEGFQKGKIKNKKIEFLVKIVPPIENIVSLIDRVDHVYTLTSLTGLEALVRGKKVTVLGKPFYAGWGLTDDRCRLAKKRRGRELSLKELFFASYILYPSYLVGGCKVNSFLSTLFRIQSDKFLLEKKELDLFPLVNVSDGYIKSIFRSDFWFAFLINVLKNKDSSPRLIKIIISNFKPNLIKTDDGVLVKVLIFYFLGLSKNQVVFDTILISLRGKIDIEIYNEILVKCQNYRLDIFYDLHWAWLLNEAGDYDFSLDFINDFSFDGDQESDACNKVKINEEKLFQKLLFQIENRRLDEALETAYILLLIDYKVREVVFEISNIFSLKACFLDLLYFSRIMQPIYWEAKNYELLNRELKAYQNLSFNSQYEMMLFFSKLITAKPNMITSCLFLYDMYFENKHDEFCEIDKDLVFGFLNYESSINNPKILALLEVGRFDEAELMARRNIKNNKFLKDIISLSQTFSYNNKLGEAIKLMERVVDKDLSSIAVHELLRLYVENSCYGKSLRLIEKCEKNGIHIHEMYKRKAYFGSRMIHNAFLTFRDISLVNNFKIYFKNQYYENLLESEMPREIFLLAIYGPGDEIRFASIYNRLIETYPETKFIISCTPRLHSLFSRSFKSIEFVGVLRPRFDFVNPSEYSNVPGSDIYPLVNNLAIDYIEKVERVAVVTDFLHDFLIDYDSFSGKSYLKVNLDLKEVIKKKLPFGKKLIGISWRSSLNTLGRNVHYLSVQDLDKVFSIEGIQFVNLQYDECQEEVDWVNNKYEGKLFNLEDIDQYNDFESVSALMSCLDLVISPATTVVELAGALGINTWLISNSSEIDWRKKDGFNTDVWHSSVKIVDVPEKGNKQLLVDEIYNNIIDYLD